MSPLEEAGCKRMGVVITLLLAWQEAAQGRGGELFGITVLRNGVLHSREGTITETPLTRIFNNTHLFWNSFQIPISIQSVIEKCTSLPNPCLESHISDSSGIASCL